VIIIAVALLPLLSTAQIGQPAFLNNVYFSVGSTIRNTPRLGLSIFDQPFFGTLGAAPTLGIGYFNEKLNLGLEGHYYRLIHPSTSTVEDFIISDTYFNLAVYYRLGSFKTSVFYSYLNSAQWAAFSIRTPFLSTASFRGAGLSFGYQYNNFDVQLNKEFFFITFGSRVTSENIFLASFWEYWTLSIDKDLYLNKDRRNGASGKGKRIKPHLVLGGIVTGSEESDDIEFALLELPNSKLFPTMGMEIRIESMRLSLFARRGIWASFQTADDYGLKVNSQLTRVGIAYFHPLPFWNDLKLGLTHVWNSSRGQQFADFLILERLTQELTPFEIQNQAVGLDIRLGLTHTLDFLVNADYYYKAHHRVGKGLNRESFRLGLLYNLY